MQWATNVINKYLSGIAHTFLLHFNVNDTVDGVSTVSGFLLRQELLSSKEIVITYNRSQGIGFPQPHHKKNFIEITEISEEELSFITPDPGTSLPVIEKALRLSKQVDGDEVRPVTAVILDYIETIVPNADTSAIMAEDRVALVTLLRWAKDEEIGNLGSPIFLLTENLSDIHPNLRAASSRIEAIKVPLPDQEDRQVYVEHLEKHLQVPLEMTSERLAALTAGLRRIHIHDIFLRADNNDQPVTIELVKDRKEEIIRSEFGDVLEILDPEKDFSSVGGMEHVKQFFLKNVVNPIKNGNLRRVPMGILLPGPPGTGKTVLAEALAKESGLNCCALNLSKILGQFVGTSERNLERALQCIEALAPTIVVVDELDQTGLSRSSGGDSGVSSRLFKRLLEFMSDTRHRGKVVFVGITNRPDLMDPALKRPGRIDKKVPILAPDHEERMVIFEVMFKRYDIEHSIANFTLAAAQTEGYTGAEIEALVLKASELAEDSDSQVVTDDHMTQALDLYCPTTQDITQMTRLAVAECNDKSLLPPKYQQELAERKVKANLTAFPKERTRRKL